MENLFSPFRLVRTYQHFFHGLLPVTLVALWYEGAAISIIWSLGFITYELLQDREKHDKSYQDVYSFLVGVALAGIGVMIWRIAFC